MVECGGLRDHGSARVSQPLDVWLDEFDLHWSAGHLEVCARSTPDGVPRRAALIELIRIDLERSWQAGSRPRVEDYVARFPILGPPYDPPAELVRAELEVRERYDDPVGRFPNFAPELALASTRPVATDRGSSTFAEQSLVFGRYRIVRTLGSGGMGVVYLARDTILSRPVALKVPRFDGGRARVLQARFRREATAAARLRHPNLAQVYDVGRDDGVDFLTMSYIEGKPLSVRIRSGQIEPAEAVRWVVKLAGGLADAHRLGVVHRDLKPANVILTPEGEPVVVDFGLAMFEDGEAARLTRDGSVFGTPAYMAPEQVRGAIDLVGPTADVYALGVILYELLTGTRPFTGSMGAIFDQALNAPPSAPSARRPGLPGWLDAACLRALAKRPEDRFASMTEFAAALQRHPTLDRTAAEVCEESIRVDTDTTAPNDDGTVDAFRQLRRDELPNFRPTRRWWLGAVGGAAVAGSGVAAYLFWGRNLPEGPPDKSVSSEGRKPIGQFAVPGSVTCLSADTFVPGRVAWGTDPFAYGLTAVNGKHAIHRTLGPGEHRGPVRFVGLSPRDPLLAVEYDDGFRFWNTTSGESDHDLDKDSEGARGYHILEVAWHPSGDALYWLESHDDEKGTQIGGKRIVPRTKSPRQDGVNKIFEEGIRCVTFKRDGNKVLLATPAGFIDSFLTQDPKSTLTLLGPVGFPTDGPITSLAFLADWEFALLVPGVPAAGSIPGTGRVEVWNYEAKKKTRDVCNTADPDVLAVSPDNRRIAWAEGAVVSVFDLTAGTAERLRGHTGRVTAVAFGPDGTTLFSGGSDQIVCRWALE